MQFKRLITVGCLGFMLLAVLLPLSLTSAPASAAPQTTTTSRFRVVIAATLTTNVDVYVDGVITTASGALGSVKPLDASGYINLIGGSHTVTLTQTATTTAVGSPFTFSFTAGAETSVILLANKTWMTLADTNVAPQPLQATARVVNLSPNNNPVSLVVDGTTPPAFTSVAYPAASASYLPYPIGAHTLAIAGSTHTPTIFTFQDGHVYSIFVFWNSTKNQPHLVAKSDTTFIKSTPTPTLGLGTPSAIPTNTPLPGTSTPIPTATVGAPRGNTNATIRLVNAVSGQTVDLLVDGMPTKVSGVAFSKASTYIPITGSATGVQHTIAVVATGTSSPILASFTTSFISQTDRSLIYYPGSTTLKALADQNIDPNTTGHTGTVGVRFVNLTLDGQAMDLYMDSSPDSTYQNIPIDQASGYQYNTVLPHTFEMHLASNGSLVTPAINAILLPARVYTVFAFEATAGNPASMTLVVKADAQFIYKIDLPVLMK